MSEPLDNHPRQQPSPDDQPRTCRSADPAAVAALGGPPSTAAALTGLLAGAPPGARAARVARVDRGRVLVLPVGAQAGPVPADPGQAGAEPAGPQPAGAGVVGPLVVGDWCVVAPVPGAAGALPAVHAVLARRTCLVRADPGPRSTPQLLAADVDTVAVVAALDRPVPLRAVERLVALAWDSGATPVLVLTKADAPEDLAGALEQVRDGSAGLEVLTVSAHTGAGLGAVAALVPPGTTLALLGSSGAGKSTLANAVLAAAGRTSAPDGPGPASAQLRTGEVRPGDRRGRHTTSWRELVPVPGGGALLDTPGLRGVGVAGSADGVDTVFADVAGLAAACRFADCRHDGEPGCAIAAAVAAGDLDPDRVRRWRVLQREAAWQASRSDARVRAEQRQVWKRRSRDARGRNRP